MSFDGMFTRAMILELKEKLLKGRVSKIDQPFDNECIMTIRKNRNNHALLLSAHPQYARLQITEEDYQNPYQAPQFAMVLRKHLNRALLVDIRQVENDRVILFEFSNADELGDNTNFQLIVELMGRHSNIILIEKESEKILDAIRHLPSSINSYRSILPGLEYKAAPTQDKINPFTSSSKTVLKRLREAQQDDLPQAIMTHLQGIGKDSAQEIAKRSGFLAIQVPQTIQDMRSLIDKGQAQGYQYHENNKSYFTAFKFLIYSNLEEESFDSLSQLLDDYYKDKANKDRLHQLSRSLSTLVHNELEKNQNKLIKQKKELDDTDQADQYRLKGEILTAYMHQVEKGMNHVSLPNFYEGNQKIDIKLDPLLTPSENAQKLFSGYQKMKNRKRYLSQEIKKTENELSYWESVQSQLDLAQADDIKDIRQELVEEGYIKEKNKAKRKNKQSKKAEPHRYQSSDGITILVGRNNKQNDELTMKKADKHHFWFHTKNIPGSHVILQSEHPSKQAIEEAAMIAAYHSKARASSHVSVDYVQVKSVRKPNGAKPGFVIYENQQSIHVTPDKVHIQNLKR